MPRIRHLVPAERLLRPAGGASGVRVGCAEPYPGRDDRLGLLDLTFHFRVGNVA